jgi:hypothetical protein
MGRVDILLRQQRLLARSAELRLALGRQAQVMRAPLALADTARSGFDWLRRNPLVPLAALLVLVLLRPRRAMLWAGYGWGWWKMFRQFQGWLGLNRPPGAGSAGGSHV